MIEIIHDTDIGADVDDAVALLWMLGRRDVRVVAVTVAPGRVGQIALVRFLLGRTGHAGVPVGGAGASGQGPALTGCHRRLLDRHGAPPAADPDAPAADILRAALEAHPGATLLSTGPLTNVAAFLAAGGGAIARSVSMGGYLGLPPLPAISREFNFDADRPAARAFLGTSRIGRRLLVGRNVTHHDGALYDRELDARMERAGSGSPALVLTRELMALRGPAKGKLLHDPLAAVLAVREELGRWREVAPFHHGGWGSRPEPGTGVWAAESVDYARFRALLAGEE